MGQYGRRRCRRPNCGGGEWTVSPGEFLGRLIKGNSYFIILAACLLLLMAITSAQGLHMATGIETLVFKDTQIYRDIDYYNENFQSTTFLILVTTDDVLDPQVIDAMARLETQILTNPKVTGVTGLQTFVAQAQSTGLLNNRANIAADDRKSSAGGVPVPGAGPASHYHDCDVAG